MKYLDIFSPLAGSKEETRQWLREKSWEFLWLQDTKNVYLKLWMHDSKSLAKSIGGNL